MAYFFWTTLYMVAHNALPQYGTHTPLLQVSLPFPWSLFSLCFLWFLSFPPLFHSHLPSLPSTVGCQWDICEKIVHKFYLVSPPKSFPLETNVMQKKINGCTMLFTRVPMKMKVSILFTLIPQIYSFIHTIHPQEILKQLNVIYWLHRNHRYLL